ncbi:putative Serum paraoxonase/arylesterase 2 [Hypsibius exemplaris]|uniref:Paraoxonase n=1 Tax=Hypsibius exemplaris TaxID=2072580 RepID=A0A1W0W9D7_HYPEX|nr:putative Serum paraoxonase/arylesterase 2 [Hypsibius exemplaris]
MGFFLRFFFYGIFVAAAGLFASRLIEFLDVNKVIHTNVPGPCKFVKGVEHGAEDIAVLPSGVAILSTGRTRTGSQGNPALMTFDFSTPQEAAKLLKLTGFKGALNPHGISVYTESGQTYVYVVNHAPNTQSPPSDTIERFLLNADGQGLTWEKSFRDSEFLGLNDLVVVGKDKFYTTNSFTMQSKLLRELEMIFFMVPLQNVVYFDGKQGTVVLNGRYGSNGINVSPDKKFLYLSELTKKRISSFRIVSSLKLEPIDTKYLGSLPNSVDVDPETGDLWVGAFPSGLAGYANWLGFANQIPSQALRIGVKDGKFAGSAEIYSDDGSVLSGASVVVPYKRAILLGTTDNKLLHCQLLSFNAALKL